MTKAPDIGGLLKRPAGTRRSAGSLGRLAHRRTIAGRWKDAAEPPDAAQGYPNRLLKPARRGRLRTMGVYTEHVLPRIVNVACNTKEALPQRRRVCEGLSGEVVEIGFGSGSNVPFYPAAVTRVAAVEPADVGWKLAAKRLRETAVPVQRSGLDGESLPFPDDSFDAALSTWTMCTIPDIDAALRELRRVLKPGAELHFVEHGLAPDEGVRRWQHRLEPLQKRVFGGCHLTRPTVELLRGAGFEITAVDSYYEKGAPRCFAAQTLGVARSP
jgi:SAM-dependent methyltransferase